MGSVRMRRKLWASCFFLLVETKKNGFFIFVTSQQKQIDENADDPERMTFYPDPEQPPGEMSVRSNKILDIQLTFLLGSVMFFP